MNCYAKRVAIARKRTWSFGFIKTCISYCSIWYLVIMAHRINDDSRKNSMQIVTKGDVFFSVSEISSTSIESLSYMKYGISTLACRRVTAHQVSYAVNLTVMLGSSNCFDVDGPTWPWREMKRKYMQWHRCCRLFLFVDMATVMFIYWKWWPFARRLVVEEYNSKGKRETKNKWNNWFNFHFRHKRD